MVPNLLGNWASFAPRVQLFPLNGKLLVTSRFNRNCRYPRRPQIAPRGLRGQRKRHVFAPVRLKLWTWKELEVSHLKKCQFTTKTRQNNWISSPNQLRESTQSCQTSVRIKLDATSIVVNLEKTENQLKNKSNLGQTPARIAHCYIVEAKNTYTAHRK